MIDYWLEKYSDPMEAVYYQWPNLLDDPMLQVFHAQAKAMHNAMVWRIKELVGDEDE